MSELPGGRGVNEKPVVVEARCRVCGHRLYIEESVKRGIGPVCWKRLKRIEALNRKLEEWAEPREDLSPDPVYGEMGYFDPEPLPVCPRCGKPSPNPRYCVSCGEPIRKALEVVA